MAAVHIVCDNCSHCVDLKGSKDSDPPALAQARTTIGHIIGNWLNKSEEEK